MFIKKVIYFPGHRMSERRKKFIYWEISIIEEIDSVFADRAVGDDGDRDWGTCL